MKVFAVFSAVFSALGILVALPFLLFWWNLTGSFGEDLPFLGFAIGLLIEIIAFGVAIATVIFAVIKKRREHDYSVPKLFLALSFIISIFGFGVFPTTVIKLIMVAGGATK